MKIQVVFAAAALALMASACGDSDGNDSAAAMVNIEKNVAPPVWNPEGEAPAPDMVEQQPVAPVDTAAVAEQSDEAAPEAKPAQETSDQKPAKEAASDSEEDL